MQETPLIKNKNGEKIDTLVEGNADADDLIIFVHGFGTNKHEGQNLFDDEALALKDDFLLIRYDVSGFGNSEGNSVDYTLQKAACDLETILIYARKNYPNKTMHSIAHSMGTFITSYLLPSNIKNIIFTGLPNASGSFVAQRIQERIVEKGGEVNPDGISVYHRTDGSTQQIGSALWKSLEEFDPAEASKKLSQKTNLTLFKPMQDHITGNDGYEAYQAIKTLTYVELDGDHSFGDEKDREVLIKNIRKILV